jgi:hypothetical protein
MRRVLILLALLGLLGAPLSASAQSTIANIAEVTPLRATASITADEGTVLLAVRGYGAAAFHLRGTWVATPVFEGSANGGQTWSALEVWPATTGASVTSSTTNGLWHRCVGGLTHVRVRADQFTSGSIETDINATTAAGAPCPSSVSGGGGSGTSSNFGAAVPSAGTAAGFSDGSNMQTARVFDIDTGAGFEYVKGVSLRRAASGGSVEIGTLTNPIRTDPTGTTTQPVSGTVTSNQGGTWNIGTLTTITNPVQSVGDVAHDAAASAVDPVLQGCYASAAAPTDVSADTDAVRAWCARNGARVVQKVFGSTLATAGNGATTAGTQRVTLSNDSTGVLASIGAITGSVTPGTGVSNLGKAVAGTAGNTDVGVAPLFKRVDTLADIAQAAGQYTQGLVNQRGALYVAVDPSSETLHDSPDGNSGPVKVGLRGTTSISAQTKVANNDRTNWYAGVDGVAVVRLHSNLEDRIDRNNWVEITDGTSQQLIAAQGSGLRACVTTLIVSNTSGTSVSVDLRDGVAGTVIANNIPAAANMGGSVFTLPSPACSSANTGLFAHPSAAASTISVTAFGFKTAL